MFFQKKPTLRPTEDSYSNQNDATAKYFEKLNSAGPEVDENWISLCEAFPHAKPEEIFQIYQKHHGDVKLTKEELHLVRTTFLKNKETHFKMETDETDTLTFNKEGWVLLDEDFGIIAGEEENNSILPNTSPSSSSVFLSSPQQNLLQVVNNNEVIQKVSCTSAVLSSCPAPNPIVVSVPEKMLSKDNKDNNNNNNNKVVSPQQQHQQKKTQNNNNSQNNHQNNNNNINSNNNQNHNNSKSTPMKSNKENISSGKQNIVHNPNQNLTPNNNHNPDNNKSNNKKQASSPQKTQQAKKKKT